MNKLGDIKTARELGYKEGNTARYILGACLVCGRQKWVQMRAGKTGFNYCRSCAAKRMKRGKGAQANHWRGGRCKNFHGYIDIYLEEKDFFYPMADKYHYVKEHRLVVAKSLGRCLHRWEIVHHKNHIRDDNRIENLQLISDLGHKQLTIMEKRIRTLEERVTLLEAENVLLKGELSEARHWHQV